MLEAVPAKSAPEQSPARSKRQAGTKQPDLHDLKEEAESKISNMVVLIDANTGEIIHKQVNI